MLPELDRLLTRLQAAEAPALGLRFGLLCVRRVEHLLESPEVRAGLREFEALLDAGVPPGPLDALATRMDRLAHQHPGSHSLDGVGHAAVSASYACAKAIAGRPRQAAEYAAYAAVYGQGGYGATTQPEAFTPEYEWQLAVLRQLLSPSPARDSAR
jgi:hypothetical protein